MSDDGQQPTAPDDPTPSTEPADTVTPAAAVAATGLVIGAAAGSAASGGAAGGGFRAGASRSLLAPVTGFLGPNGLVAVVAGGLGGVVAMSALIAGGTVQVHPVAPAAPATAGPPPQLALLSCAGDGPVVAMAGPGEHMLFTGAVDRRLVAPGSTSQGPGSHMAGYPCRP